MPDFKEGAQILLKNVEVLYPYLIEPDTKYAPMWSVTLILDDKAAEKFKKLGANVRKDKDGRNLLKVKRKKILKDGTQQSPPVFVGRDGRTPFPEEIGDGSIVNIKLWAKQYTTGEGETRLVTYLNAVQVVEAQPPNNASFDPIDDDDGDAIPF